MPRQHVYVGAVVLLLVLQTQCAPKGNKQQAMAKTVEANQDKGLDNGVQGKAEETTITTEEEEDCLPYRYCEGEHFPQQVPLDGRTITCDQVPEPRYRCCLPVTSHYVCYNIMVDGQFLNYDGGDAYMTTHFTQLCEQMAAAHNRTLSKYTSASVTRKGGNLVYRYDHWAELASPSSHHIRDLACGVRPETTGPSPTTQD